MCDIVTHILLNRSARKYTKLPKLNELVACMPDTFNQIMRENICKVNPSLKSSEIFEARRKKLRYALEMCPAGDSLAKQYVKDMIQDILIERYKVSEKNINELIYFDSDVKLSDWDRFQILLHVFEKSYDKEAFTQLLVQGRLENRRIIHSEDLRFLYGQFKPALNFLEKLEIVTQRIYSLYKGLGIADDICEMNIDGVSVSDSVSENVPDTNAKRTLWIFWRGKPVNLSFLNFQSERELERICNNIYRNNRPIQRVESRGCIVGEMYDHSRVIIAEPPFCKKRVFFVRKLNKNENRSLQSMYTQKNHELVERFIIFLVKGCQSCAITGSPGSGKTTLIIALIEYINSTFNLKVRKPEFELYLRDIYPERSIAALHSTDETSDTAGSFISNFIGSQEVIALQKKGAAVFTMFTHHAETTQSLIGAMTNVLLSESICCDELEARRQAADAIRFNIHVGTDAKGERYIERITEIVPCDDMTGDTALRQMVGISGDYCAKEIIAFEDGEYIQKETVTPGTAQEIAAWLEEEKAIFLNEFA